MVPACAPARPPDTGASSIRKPAASIFASSARAASGATVAQHSTTAPFASFARQPLAPNSTSSVCAAFTTNTTTASSIARADPPARATAAPPAACNSGARASRTSQPVTCDLCAAGSARRPCPWCRARSPPTFMRLPPVPEALDCRDQRAADAGFQCRMSGIRHDRQPRRRPRRGEFEGGARRTDHVVAALHDLGRNARRCVCMLPSSPSGGRNRLCAK